MTLRTAILAACLTLAPGAALAGPLWIGPTAGVGLPVGDFKDVASTGFNIGLQVDAEAGRNFAYGGEIGWQTYGGNDDFEKALSAGVGETVDVTTTAIPVLIHGKLMVPSGDRSVPYAKVALGLYRTRSEIETPSGTEDGSATDFAFGIGGGWNVRSGERMKYGIEGMLHLVSSDPSSNIFLVRLQMSFGAGGS